MNSHSNIFRETLVTIVLYETEPGKSSTYLSLTNALRKAGEKMDLFFYDNSPASQDTPVSDQWTLRYEHDPTNGGVSKAYNRACEVAKGLEKKWLWLWDQDDVFDGNAISLYQKAVEENPLVNIFVPIAIDGQSICSPFRFRFGGGWKSKEIKPGVYALGRLKFINSGLLISIEAFERADGYDNDFPLDFSDLAFIERLRKKYDQFVVTSTTIQHRLSANTINTEENDLIRFSFYKKGAQLFVTKYVSSKWILIRSLGRAVRLSFQHKSLRFLQEYF